MSIVPVVPFLTKNYGLKNEDLDEIIQRENLRDVSDKFSVGIERTLSKFESKMRIRILEFSENSGSTTEVTSSFIQLINAGRNIFYHHLYSNKDCCVFFLYSGYKRNEKLFNFRILPHEFAHHFQFIKGFPCLLPKGCPSELYPQFAIVHEIGPRVGDVYVDNLLVSGCLQSFFKDFSERISDFVCEGILISKGFTKGLIEEYREIIKKDPARLLPRSSPNYRAGIRYVRRLALRDEAEWQSLIYSIYREGLDFQNSELRYNMKRVLKLNDVCTRRKQAFREIFDISTKMKYDAFKEVSVCVDYIKKVSLLLNIQIRSNEKW